MRSIQIVLTVLFSFFLSSCNGGHGYWTSDNDVKEKVTSQTENPSPSIFLLADNANDVLLTGSANGNDGYYFEVGGKAFSSQTQSSSSSVITLTGAFASLADFVDACAMKLGLGLPFSSNDLLPYMKLAISEATQVYFYDDPDSVFCEIKQSSDTGKRLAVFLKSHLNPALLQKAKAQKDWFLGDWVGEGDYSQISFSTGQIASSHSELLFSF
jgi:hypothetical protein